MGEALERTVEAGQSLIVRRMELLVAETLLLVRDSGMVVFASVVGLIGWVYLMCAVTVGLSDHYPRVAVLLGVGVLHLGAAFLLFMRGRGR